MKAMKLMSVKTVSLGFGLVASMAAANVAAEEGLDKLYGDVRLRLETVSQDNAAEDATALTVRSRIGYASEAYGGFSGRLEVENNTALIDDYKDTVGGGAQYSVVADPEVTEVDQAFIQYQGSGATVKLGRQVLTFDNHRFVGHVGWRQDRQTFDGVSVSYAVSKALKTNLAYISKRNRIFAQDKDLDAKDLLLHAAYKASFGQVTGYAYLLEVDNNSKNGLDTYGLRYSGETTLDSTAVSYAAEWATQTSTSGAIENSARYALLELAAVVNKVKLTVGYESLGSDNGAFGFATPLATGHKFNGWSDQFLGTPKQGLVDVYVSLAGKVAGGKWLLAYHDFSADESTATVDDLGSELNVLYARKLGKGVTAGIKYAAYSAGDAAAGKVDTDKLWLWTGFAF